MAKAVKTIKTSKTQNKNYAAIPEIEKYLNSKYNFRHNPILDRTEFKSKKNKIFQLLTERDVNSLFRELNNASIKCTITTIRSLLNSNFVEEKDPFKDYFSSLPKWKKTDPDYISQLAATVTAENEDFWKWAIKKWLVSMAACAVNSNIINQQVLVFVGKQGIG